MNTTSFLSWNNSVCLIFHANTTIWRESRSLLQKLKEKPFLSTKSFQVETGIHIDDRTIRHKFLICITVYCRPKPPQISLLQRFQSCATVLQRLICTHVVSNWSSFTLVPSALANATFSITSEFSSLKIYSRHLIR